MNNAIDYYADLNVREISWKRVRDGKHPLHRCDLCGAVGEWGSAWSWYGSVRELEESGVCVKLCGCASADAEALFREKKAAYKRAA